MGNIVNLATLDELKEMCKAEAPVPAEPLTPERFARVLDSLQAKCVRREYCVSDIRKKALKAVDGDNAKAEELVKALVRERFVDDMRFASAFAREKSSLTGWGPSKIRYALQMKGIDRETISSALEEIDENAADAKLLKVLTAKWRLLREDPYGKFKLIKFGLSRGYAYDDVAQAADKAMNEE